VLKQPDEPIRSDQTATATAGSKVKNPTFSALFCGGVSPRIQRMSCRIATADIGARLLGFS
jgi:hypothetical protein